MSKEHSDAIVWNEDQNEKSPHVGKEKPVARNRQYTFAVQKTKEQEESVSMHDGFKVSAGSRRYGVCFLDENLGSWQSLCWGTSQLRMLISC
jgi:hypothetical protein